MKTKPDEMTLSQWMDGALEGEELNRVEAWAQEHPELLAERDAIQAMSASIREHVAESVEPPYPDFFNQKILQAIEEDQLETVAEPVVSGNGVRGFWQWLTAPVAIPLAGVAMALCFYLGMQVQKPDTLAVVGDSSLIVKSNTSVYTPDGAVHAKMFSSADAEATVIVLEGLDDIPDDFEMAGGPTLKNSGSMMIHAEESSPIF